MSFEVDTKDFDMKFAEIVKNTIPRVAADALFRAGALVIRDALREEPTVPKKTGNLRRTQHIETPDITSDDISVEAGFNADYAARVHEWVPSEQYGEKQVNWTLAGSGPKFLSTKLARNKEKYMKYVADEIAKAAGGS
jgi:hypothetical protein